MQKKLLLLSVFLLIAALCSYVNAEDDNLKMFRFQGKIGIPNLIGGALEIIPFQIDEYSFGGECDLSYIPITISDTKISILYLGLTPKIYFSPVGTGFSLGIGYGKLSVNAEKEFTTSEFDDPGTYVIEEESAKATATVNANFFLIRVGYRWIWGPITLALEGGYGLGIIDDEVDVEVEYPSGKITEKYNTGDIPVSVGTVGNISFGFAF